MKNTSSSVNYLRSTEWRGMRQNIFQVTFSLCLIRSCCCFWLGTHEKVFSFIKNGKNARSWIRSENAKEMRKTKIRNEEKSLFSDSFFSFCLFVCILHHFFHHLSIWREREKNNLLFSMFMGRMIFVFEKKHRKWTAFLVGIALYFHTFELPNALWHTHGVSSDGAKVKVYLINGNEMRVLVHKSASCSTKWWIRWDFFRFFVHQMNRMSWQQQWSNRLVTYLQTPHWYAFLQTKINMIEKDR